MKLGLMQSTTDPDEAFIQIQIGGEGIGSAGKLSFCAILRRESSVSMQKRRSMVALCRG